MFVIFSPFWPALVALLAEGVDRNTADTAAGCVHAGSPSSRRAWIEILVTAVILLMGLSPSSRRAWIEIGDGVRPRHIHICRPPRGGRG